ncbi:MAG: hypothetical protein FD123_4296 [Bacteroidetes bacterium]|nr:MAG: hypothetical protein FD123_4296 [Bacteroidota bacterium]
MNQNYNQGYNNYNQGQYPYQQPPGGFPPPPPRPPRTWWQRNGLVFSLLLGLGLLIGIGIFAVHYFTKKISDGIHDTIETAAEVSETYTNNQLEYDNLYAIYSSDSQKYAALKRKTDALKSQTETLLAQIDDLSNEFRDTVNARSKGKGFLGGMLVSQHFFIKAGRAHRLAQAERQPGKIYGERD